MALGLAGAPVVVLLGGIIGARLAPSPSLSTLPVAVLVTGVAVFTAPASLIMKRIGRRAGFMSASSIAALASAGGIYAVHSSSFTLFCTTAFFIGANLAFVQQYRFAASESVSPERVGQAVSFVLMGGIAAAFLGPELARQARSLLPFGLYSGSFAALSVLYLLNAALLFFLVEPVMPEGAGGAGEERPLGAIVRQPLYLAAVMAGLVAFGVMSFVMTATPVSMHLIDRFTVDETAWVIQSHVIAMYVPSLFTGALIGRYGLGRVMLAGVALMAGCSVVAMVDRHFVHYLSGLVLLGIGWNFLFVGGTTLLTRTYSPAERFKAQAVNDFAVFGFQALASLSAGTVIFRAGWETLNSLSIPVLVLMGLLILRLRKKIEAGEAAPT